MKRVSRKRPSETEAGQTGEIETQFETFGALLPSRLKPDDFPLVSPSQGSEQRNIAATPSERTAPSSSEVAYKGILRALHEGRFVPGQRLVEPDLMKMFGIGRGTIREILNRLSSAGIVTIIPHRGATVRFFSRREVVEILDVVELLLGLAMRRAAEQVGAPGNANLLRRTLNVLSECYSRNDFAGFVLARESFYRAIMRMGANRELRRLFPTAQVHLMRVQLRAYGLDSFNLDDYQRMYDAIVSGDPMAAELAGRYHVQYRAQSVAGLPDRGFAGS